MLRKTNFSRTDKMRSASFIDNIADAYVNI
jgi:hypothetical protein